MQPILIAYGSTEGHTRKVAEFIAERLRVRGHRVDVVDVASPLAQQVQPSYLGALLGGSLHQDKHQQSLEEFVKANKPWLGALPLGFFSVSLSAALPDVQQRAEAQQAADEFLPAHGLRSVATACVAGALKVDELDYFRRFMLRQIAGKLGAGNDLGSAHEYTDWQQLEAFVDQYLQAAGISH
jgi:menaquinone-dependent protoporphyrinogen oxidase